MLVSEKQLINDLKAGKYQPVYLIGGDENFYIDRISDYFEQNIIDKDSQDFNRTILYGSETDMQTVLSYAKQFPWMSPIRLVLIKEAQLLENWGLVEEYLKQPMPQTLLVFCYRKKLDKRKKIYSAVKEQGCIVESNKLKDENLPEWIGSYVNETGHAITQKGAYIIAEYIGNGLCRIANELSKVCISLKPGEVITEDIIERFIGISKDYNVFELQNAIGRRDVVRCNRIVNHFAANPKDNPIQMVIPALYGYFIKIMIYHQIPDKKMAAAAMKIAPYFMPIYAAAARNYTLGKLASCIGYLYEADLKSKGVGNANTVTDGEILKELVFKIIH